MPLAELTLQSLHWLPIAVVAGAVAIAGTWWLYRPQLRLRGRGVRIGLPVLRSMALLALAIALIKPVVLRAKSASERGTIVVLVDRSASMNVTDGGRSPAQLIALADGLKLLPASAAAVTPTISADEVEQIRNQGDRIARAASELDYAKLANRGVDAAQARLDDSISQLGSQVQALLSRLKDKKSARLAERLTILIAAGQKDRDAWMKELHNRIERVATAASDSENNSAEQVYRGSADVRAVCDRLASLSRLDLAKLAVRQTFPANDSDGATVVYGFATAVEPMNVGENEHGETASGQASASGNSNGAGADHAPVGASTQPDGVAMILPATRPVDPATATTNLTGAIRSAVQHFPPGGVRAVVLMSDGRQVGGETSVETMAAGLGDVPVFTVRMARLAPPRDVAISRVIVPPRAFVGETLTVHVEVRSTGVRGEVPVTLTVGSVAQTKPVVFLDDTTASVEFTTKLDHAGPLRLGVVAAPQKDEISTANNSVERWVNVLSDKVQVVALAQSAGRDFQFLRDALSRTPWVKLDESTASSPDAPASVTKEQLADADLVILEDAGGNLLSADQWQQVRKLVAERGAGAILLAGDAHAPDELLIRPDSAELLPFATPQAASWRNWAGEWPSLRAVPDASAGKRSALPEALRLTDDADSSLKKWQELPAMYRLMNLSPLKPNAQPLLVDSETHAAVVTDSRVGAGHVLFVGMNETWRWRYKIGQRDQDRFWLQLVRQVADEPYAASAGGVSIDADRLVVEPGKPLKLRARIRDAAGNPSSESAANITVKAADGSTRVESLPAITDGSGRYQKTVNDWPAGEYQLSVEGAAEPKLTVRIAASDEAELANLAGDDRLLRRIADATNGQAIGPEQLADLPAQLAERASQRPQVAEIRLWDSPYLFAFVLACLGLEWAVRKQAGLA